MASSEENKDNPLLPKLKKLYDLKIENDDELLDGLKVLSLIFNDNNIRNRRNLRCLIEKQGLDLRKSILQDFKAVVDEARKVNDQTKHMNIMCQDMSERLSKTKCQTRELIEKTTKLQNEGLKLEMKKQVSEAFCAKFQVSIEDRAILSGVTDEKQSTHQSEDSVIVDERFLNAMDRLKQVETDCKLLLRLPHQTIGLETLESVNHLSDKAYERLIKWSAANISRMTESECEISNELAGAIMKLQERPVLLHLVLNEWRQARSQATETAFVQAISTSSTTNELDPLRFVGDILAVVHQLVAGEREHWRSLWRLASSNDTNCDYGGPETACDGLCRPLKIKLEQILVGEQDPLILYKIQHLIQFYKSTISQIIRGDCELCSVLGELQALSWRLFFGSLQSHTHTLLDKADNSIGTAVGNTTSRRLAPSNSVKHALRLLEDVLTARDVSMLPSPTGKAELHQILQTVIDPLLQHCSLSASNAGPIEAAVYLCNCLYVCQSSLARFEYTDAKLEQIQGQLDANIDSLVSYQAGYVIKSAGLGDLYELVESNGIDDKSITAINLAERIPEAALKKMMIQFDSFLSHPDSLLMPQLVLLTGGNKLRDLVRRRAHDLVHNAYSKIYTSIHHEESGYSNPAILVPRTPDQVADLILNC